MNKVKKIAKYFLTIIGIIATATIISLALTYKLNITTEVAEHELETLPSDTTTRSSTGESDYVKDDVIDDAGEIRVVDMVTVANGVWRPVPESSDENAYEIYCVEPGVNLSPTGVSRAQVQAYNGRTTGTSSRCASWTKLTSDPYYSCDHNHLTPETTELYGERLRNGNSFDIGYIISYYNAKIYNGQIQTLEAGLWSDAKQYAIWSTDLSKRPLPHRNFEASTIAEGEIILKQAEVYKTMTEQIQGTSYYNPRTNTTFEKEANKMAIEPTEEQEQEMIDNIKVDTDYDTKMHKVGPFTLNYVYGWSSEFSGGVNETGDRIISQYAMSGISDMYLVDEDGNRIDIAAFIRPEIDDIVAIQRGEDAREGFGTGSYYDAPKFWDYHSLQGEDNLNKIDLCSYNIWRNYPAPEEEFYVEFKYDGELPSSLKLHVEYSYLKIDYLACIREDTEWTTYDKSHYHTSVTVGEGENKRTRRRCRITYGVKTISSRQDLTYIDYSRYIVKEDYEIPFYVTGSTNMKIGGTVFEDMPQTKEDEANGVKDDNDILLSNIQVTLYEADANGEIARDENGNEILAQLATLEEEFPDSTAEELAALYPDDYKRRINPTLTDENGYYEFRGVNRNKKYIVKFTYNGETYLPTEYLSKANDYSYDSVAQMVAQGAYDSPGNDETLRERWQETSKGLEKVEERNALTERFSEIGSSPKNYRSTNSLGEVGDYNETFSENELLGFDLQVDGRYEQTGIRLIDSYLTIDENGQIVDRSQTVDENYVITVNHDQQVEEGLISTRIKQYIDQNHRYPTNIKEDIYAGIVQEMVQAGTDEETAWKMLQFIEDCKINSYTFNDNSTHDIYPVYNQFTTFVDSGNKYPENSYSDGTLNRGASEYSNHTLGANGTGEFTYIKFVRQTYNGNQVQVAVETTADDPMAIRIQRGTFELIANKTWGGMVLTEGKGTIEYKNVYPGQLYINQGLWRRQEVDLALQKDIYKATVKINGKTEVYDYDSYGHGVITPSEISNLKAEIIEEFGEFNEEEFKRRLNEMFNETARDRWDIHLRMSDYDNYYAAKHNRALYRADYEYVTQPGRTGAPLDVYVTYKISIRNQSQSILGQVMEVVDYYDVDYEYIDALSWVTYADGEGEGSLTNDISSEQYYDMMDNYEYGTTTSNSSTLTNARSINSSDTTRYDQDTQSDITSRTITDGNTGVSANYNAVYIRGLEGKKLASGETAYIYLTFRVRTDENGHVIVNESYDNEEEDKKNFAEINGYKTYYRDDTVLPNYGTVGSNNEAGLIDIDSKPGNLEAADLEVERYESNFEDDTDRAKDLHIYVDDNATREINGVVWEDQRNVTVDGAVIGNGIRDEGENTVNNIWVELYEIELDDNGNPILESDGSYRLKDGPVQIYEGGWTSANEHTAGEGNYTFTGFIPGDYIVRFNYGGNDNNATYNGQDFKSTTYQVGIDQTGNTDEYQNFDANKDGIYVGYTDVENQNETGLYGYNIAKADQDSNNYSDAKDIWSRREQINNYSNNGGNGVTNELAQTLSEHTTPNDATQMKAETGVIVAEVEYNRQNSNSSANAENEANSEDTLYNSNGAQAYQNGNDINAVYVLNNVDLGLVERPKAQLELNKKVTNVTVTLANGQIIVESTTQGPYLSWLNGEAYDIASKKTEQDGAIYETDYNSKQDGERYKDDVGGHGTEFYEYREELITDKFTSHASREAYNGLIQINMDEELMHGATIRIEYTFTVTNAGEVDYDGKDFYYRGNRSGNIVRTSADQVIDYVNNNLQFRAEDNADWSIISTEEVINGQNGEGSKLVNNNVAEIIRVNGVDQYNSIIQTETLSTALAPGESVSNILVLSQLITAQNDTDDLTYDNIAEIVKTTNSVGRRMAYSVVGNQNPTGIPSEVDAAKAERVMILPPFGNMTYIYIIIAIAAASVLVVGIILIKKKVVGKK